GTPVEQEVADVGGVELLLVVQDAWTGAGAHAFVLLDDLVSELLLPVGLGLAALVADEGQADLVEIPAFGLEDRREHGARDELGDAVTLLRRREREPGLHVVGDARDGGSSVALRDLLHRPEPGFEVREEVGIDIALRRNAVYLHPRLRDDSEAPLGTEDHLANAG